MPGPAAGRSLPGRRQRRRFAAADRCCITHKAQALPRAALERGLDAHAGRHREAPRLLQSPPPLPPAEGGGDRQGQRRQAGGRGPVQLRLLSAEAPLPAAPPQGRGTERRGTERRGTERRGRAPGNAPPPAGPFLKWAGGKRRLLPEIAGSFPPRFGRYIEPFLGGGAVLFHVLSAHPGAACSASDANPDLVAAYEAVRDDVELLIRLLRGHAERYAAAPREYYYSVRAASPRGGAERAARLLFLNRTCFNGLYRVNGSGRFNVPFGGYKSPNIPNADALRAASSILSSAGPSIECRDFEDALAGASAGDLVYLDPPYHPASPTAKFTQYTRGDFGAGDLERLAAACRALDGRGCRVLLSNSDTPEVRRLFSGGPWRRRRLAVDRMINSDGAKRRGHTELLIRNY